MCFIAIVRNDKGQPKAAYGPYPTMEAAQKDWEKVVSSLKYYKGPVFLRLQSVEVGAEPPHPLT